MGSERMPLRPQLPAERSRPRIMGVVNVTPDSFSDGGETAKADAAIARGVALADAGAQLIDVGGESTRPGAERLPVEQEQRRVVPVIRGLVERGVSVSIDTMNAATALAAAELGASVINDVSGGLADEGMARVAAETGLHFVAMHWRGHSASMDSMAVYDDVLHEVREELKRRAAELLVVGVRPDRIILDPGLGFAKTADHNWRLLANLPALGTIGYPILIGASRKRFLGGLLPPDATAKQRDPATATISALAAQAGVWGVRVHNVEATKAALDVWEAMQP